jgi:hypothetical protein
MVFAVIFLPSRVIILMNGMTASMSGLFRRLPRNRLGLIPPIVAFFFFDILASLFRDWSVNKAGHSVYQFYLHLDLSLLNPTKPSLVDVGGFETQPLAFEILSVRSLIRRSGPVSAPLIDER